MSTSTSERLVVPVAVGDEDQQDRALRPRTLAEYIGQAETRESLAIAIGSAKLRNQCLEHVLLSGPPGLGKTSLAGIIATEMGSKMVTTSGPMLQQPFNLVGILTSLEPGDVLFVDEIHRMPRAVEEFLYTAMEDFRVDVVLDKGMNSSAVSLDLKPFTLVGATTRQGSISKPLRDRFGLQYVLDLYSAEDLATIVRRSANLLGIALDPLAACEVACRARGTARVANRLLKRVRDYMLVRGSGHVDMALVEAALAVEGIDSNGLDRLDRRYLQTLAVRFGGRPTGLNTLASTMQQDTSTLEDVVEPWLLHRGYIEPTSNGRRITAAGRSVLAEAAA